MSSVERSGTFRLGDRLVKRLGYGAMQLSGPGIFGPPRDRETALAVLPFDHRGSFQTKMFGWKFALDHMKDETELAEQSALQRNQLCKSG